MGFLFLVFYPFSQAVATVWIASPDMSPLQLKAHVMALGESHKTYAQSQWERFKKQTEAFELKEKIKKAQGAYLSGDSSITFFKEITDLAYLGDWDEEQRRVILYAFLRLAQLEVNSNKKKALLISAGRFITEDLSSNYPEYSLFPPPLIEELNSLRSKQNSFLVDWKKLFPRYEILLINGRKMESRTRLNEGKYRITVLSSFHAPWIQTISLSDLLSQVVKTQPLTVGYCDSLKIKPQWNQKNIKLLKQKNCAETYGFNTSIPSLEGKIKALTKQNGNKTFNEQQKGLLKQDLPGMDSENLREAFLIKPIKDFEELENSPEEEKGFFNKKNWPKWIVVGGTALALGVVIALRDPSLSPESKVFH